MVELTRTVRFCLGADGSPAGDAPVSNSFAGWPPMRGLGRYYELRVACVGETDAVTGYFMNIKRIDEAARRAALPVVATAAREPDHGLGSLMHELIRVLQPELEGAVRSAALRLTPFYEICAEASDMDSVLVSHQYEFSAAHRLHAPELDAARNVEIFGKCNNPAGHGHNYQLEVTLRCPIDERGHIPPVEKLDEVVNRVVIDRFDHKHLNEDVDDFQGLNPSVEHISRRIYGLLSPEVEQMGLGLTEVKVWETGKTACAYRG